MGKILLKIEDIFNKAFSNSNNPLYHTGALAVFCMWVLLATGIYIFIFYKINAPYASTNALSTDQWYLGGLLRSMHRYAADGLVLFSLLHLLKELSKRRIFESRNVAWTSGVLSLVVIILTGLTGYLLVWDERAWLIAEAGAGALDVVAIFGESLRLAFSSPDLITPLFFFIMLFLHLAVPVFLFMALWIHVIRITRPAIHPPRPVAIVYVIALVIMSIILPATSLPEASTGRLITTVQIDWFYMFAYPLLDSIGAPYAVITLAIALGIAALLPWIIPHRKTKAASVIEQNCTGCGLCHEDCPYSAVEVSLSEEPNKPAPALIRPKRCARCGICVGSCEYGAIDFPEKQAHTVAAELRSALGSREKDKKLVVAFVCSKVAGYKASELSGIQTASIELPCIAMLHRGWIAYALDSGADTVAAIACSEKDCTYRTGTDIIQGRIGGHRPPALDRKYASRTIYISSSLYDQKAFEKAVMDAARQGSGGFDAK